MNPTQAIVAGFASALMVLLLTAPTVQAAPGNCNYGSVSGTSAACSGSKAYNCPGPSVCWVGSYCTVIGTGSLGCSGPLGASCGPATNGCSGYGGTYVGPGTSWGTSGTIYFNCYVNGVGTGINLQCN